MSQWAPPITPDTSAWWEATRGCRLLVQRCGLCGHHQHYPRTLCLACHGDELELVEASGHATVWSYSVVHRSPDPSAFEAPYVVALVRLAEGPVLTTNLVDIPHEELACDRPVQVRWRPLSDGRYLPVFGPPEADPETNRER